MLTKVEKVKLEGNQAGQRVKGSTSDCEEVLGQESVRRVVSDDHKLDLEVSQKL